MRSILTATFLVAMLSHSSAAMAQETETPTEPEAETTTEDGATPLLPSDLSLGEPVGPAVGQPYILEEIGDWQKRCVKAPEGQDDPCSLYQLLEDADGNKVAEVNMSKLPDGSRAVAGATIVAPLETLLTEQLSLAVDGANQRRYPFTFCNAAGCVARLGFVAEEVAAFKRGIAATIRLVPAAAPTSEVVLTMSLTGFTAGFDGLDPVQ